MAEEKQLQKTNGREVDVPRETLAKLQKFQKLLDAPPKFVVDERIGGESFQQQPITHVEHLLKKIFFGLYKVEIIHYGMMVNEITMHVRLYVYHPVIHEWLHYDGISAVPVMQDAQAKVADFMNTKKKKALALNLPTAYSIALKNAAKKIGKVFGADLNRKYEDTYSPFGGIAESQEPLNE